VREVTELGPRLAFAWQRGSSRRSTEAGSLEMATARRAMSAARDTRAHDRCDDFQDRLPDRLWITLLDEVAHPGHDALDAARRERCLLHRPQAPRGGGTLLVGPWQTDGSQSRSWVRTTTGRSPRFPTLPICRSIDAPSSRSYGRVTTRASTRCAGPHQAMAGGGRRACVPRPLGASAYENSNRKRVAVRHFGSVECHRAPTPCNWRSWVGVSWDRPPLETVEPRNSSGSDRTHRVVNAAMRAASNRRR
jgi:hypothetical protein